ncbi:SoxR reducing system RseC family protein [Shewanella cyperi]|uniref:SoxR reducing system RseC family protein n=1 Tax=Shewanella cyperi TaxID=2814292 RepID=A0A974XPE2_9GAMM|nr:SoxR reducing system RseC family protein [Shewanella cyperi]QSX30821.1 SoxR reducing system RseC family protein [Shewanella cyperi]QSX41600.1 SoxR reducing system RseC family protein [Shewanella cyperi]
MMEELARVVAIEPEGWVQLEVELKSACGHCSASDNCGTSAVAKAFAPKHQRFSIHTDVTCQAGDMVRLGLPESVLLKAAALVYLLPLAGLLLGAVLGQSLGAFTSLGSDGTAIVLGLAGAAATWWLGKRLATRLESDSQPIILARLGPQLSVGSHS